MEGAASKGVHGSVNDGLAPKGPPGQVPEGGFENGVEGPEAINGGGQDELVTSGTSVFDGEIAIRNPVVLTRLFEVRPPCDLAKFRLVCKEWRDLSLKSWRASSTLKLGRNAADDGGLYLKGGTPLHEFLAYLEDPGTKCGVKPFSRIKLEGWIFDPGNTQIQRFWNLLGGNLVSLKFRRCRFPKIAEFRRIIYTACPNLILLSFWACEFDEVDGSVSEIPTHYKAPSFGERLKLKCLSVKCQLLPASWLEFLSHFPSLSSIKQHRRWLPHTDMDGSLERMLDAIRIVRGHDAQSLPLVQFDIGYPTIGISPDETASQNKIFGLIRKLNLPLKSLVLQLDAELKDEFANDVFQFHSGTLKHLIVVSVTDEGEPLRKFNCRMQLENVKKLQIDHALFQCTGILKCVPNLKSLTIDEDYGSQGTRTVFQEWKEELGRNEAVKLPNVTYLDYFVDNEFGSFNNSGDLETLTKLLPNVEKLLMALDDEHFAIVCQHWKGLKELTVNCDYKYCLSDTGLTGGILRMANKLWEHETVRPNIKDLKELRVFSCNNSNSLTDISVYHGLLHLPQLKSVTFDMEARNEDPRSLGLGEEAQHDLREKGVKLKIFIN